MTHFEGRVLDGLAYREKPTTADLLPIALLGIVHFSILITLLKYALSFAPSDRVVLPFATMRPKTIPPRGALVGERLAAAKARCVRLTILGVGISRSKRVLKR